MIYFVLCVLKGEIESYHRYLVDVIARKFDLVITKEENIPTHFTLKYSFETKDIGEIESLATQFCEMYEKTSVKVGGFGSFPPRVVFIKIQPSKFAWKSYLDFVAELRNVKGISWREIEGENLRFHATVAEECNDKFESVWELVQEKERYFNCWFDNLTILEEISRENNILRWKIHKTYWMQ